MASIKNKKLTEADDLRERQQIDTALIAEIKRRLRTTSGQGEMYGQELDAVYREFGNPLVNAALDELRREDGEDNG